MKQNKITITLHVPEYMLNTLYDYEDEGYININEFIESVIRHDLDLFSDFPTNIGDYFDYEEGTFPLKVNIANDIAFELGLFASRTQNSYSTVVGEVLNNALFRLEDALADITNYGFKIKPLYNNKGVKRIPQGSKEREEIERAESP